MDNRNDIVDVLIEEKHLDINKKQAALDVLNQVPDSSTPWYIQLLIGGGAWLASLLFLLFLGLMNILDGEQSFAIFGAVLVVITLTLSLLTYKSGSLFLEQVLLAGSLTGHAALVGGVAGLFQDNQMITGAVLVLLSVVNILFYKSQIHKLLATWALLVGCAMLLTEIGVPQLSLLLVYLLVPAAIVAWMWMNESRFLAGGWINIGRPVLYALTIFILYGAYVSEQFSWMVSDFLSRSGNVEVIDPNTYIKVLGVGYFLIFTYVISTVLKRLQVKLASLLGLGLFIVAALLCVAFYQSSSILVAVILLIIGIERGHKVLVPVAVISLVAFYSEYYYNLNATLMEKSMILSASGLVMIVAGLVVSRVGAK